MGSFKFPDIDVIQTAQSTDHNSGITLLLSSSAWVLLSSPIDVLQTAQSTDHNSGITLLLSSCEWVLLSYPIDVLHDVMKDLRG